MVFTVPLCPERAQLRVSREVQLDIYPQSHGPAATSFAATLLPTDGTRSVVLRVTAPRYASSMATITVSAGQQADGSSRPAGGKRPSWRHSSLSCQLGLLGRPSARAAPTAQLRLAVGLSRWAAPGPLGGCGMAV